MVASHGQRRSCCAMKDLPIRHWPQDAVVPQVKALFSVFLKVQSQLGILPASIYLGFW